MASQIFNHGKMIVNKARKAKAATREAFECLESPDEVKRLSEQAYMNVIKTETEVFEEILRVAGGLKSRYNEYIESNHKRQAYMVTIRPSTKATWDQFYQKVESFLGRKFFVQYVRSYEQKGTSMETLGEGFHVHIVCETTHRSKGELLRDTKSTFKQWIEDGLVAENCIQVDLTKNPEALVKNYLIDYVSEDDHKACTKEWDALWRAKIWPNGYHSIEW